MDTLPNDILDTIHKYKHQLEYRVVIDEMEGLYCLGCGKSGNFNRFRFWCGCPLDLDFENPPGRQRQSRCSRCLIM